MILTMPRKIALAAVLVTWGSAGAAMAHHSFAAEFDANAPVTLKGTITKMEWINPHSWIHIDVKNPDGTVTEWMIEGGTPNTLFRRGFTREAVKAGMEITVEGYRAKNGANDLIVEEWRSQRHLRLLEREQTVVVPGALSERRK